MTDADESYPDIETVSPRESFKFVLGDNVQTDLLLFLRAYRGSPTAAELATALRGYPRDEIVEEVAKLGRFGALTCPQPGRYRLTANPVAVELGHIIDACADQTRENRGMRPLAEALTHE